VRFSLDDRHPRLEHGASLRGQLIITDRPGPYGRIFRPVHAKANRQIRLNDNEGFRLSGSHVELGFRGRGWKPNGMMLLIVNTVHRASFLRRTRRLLDEAMT
jgi:hypothetical protein